MDIIVTTPKTEMESAAAEAEFIKITGSGYYYRFFKTLPKIKVGDKVFYTENGFITGFATVVDTSNDDNDFECEATQKAFSGKYVSMDATTWKWVKPIPYKGFQGFRYAKDLDYEVVGDWRDAKPKS